MLRLARRRCAWKLLCFLLAALLHPPPARSATYQQQLPSGCGSTLTRGSSESIADVPAGAILNVLSYPAVGKIQVAAAARGFNGSEGTAGGFEVQLWDDGSGAQLAAAQAANGCADTGRLRFCPAPTPVRISLRCLNVQQSCKLRVVTMVEGCQWPPPRMLPPAPRPRTPPSGLVSAPGPSAGPPGAKAVAADSMGAGGSQDGSLSAPGDSSMEPAAAPVSAPGSALAAPPGAATGSHSSRSGSSSPASWLIVGAAAVAALMSGLLLWVCWRHHRRRRASDLLELGAWRRDPSESAAPLRLSSQFLLSLVPLPPSPTKGPLPLRQQWMQPQAKLAAGAQEAVEVSVAPLPLEAAAGGINWVVVIKPPGSSRAGEHAAAGHGALWLDSRHIDPRWRVIPSINSWLPELLEAGPDSWQGWLMYSDEPPSSGLGVSAAGGGGSGSSGGGVGGVQGLQACGRCKGVVVWNRQTVGWLLHSVPRWPDTLSSGTLPPIPSPELESGHSFFWTRLPRAMLPIVLRQVSQMEAYVYALHDPDAHWRHPVGQVYRSISPAHLSRQQLFRGYMWHVARGGECVQDIYQHFLPHCRGSHHPAVYWSVQTSRQVGRSDPYITEVTHLHYPPAGKVHPSASDLSKWAVSNQGPRIAFLGDQDREAQQRQRGGGGVLLADERLWVALTSLIHELQP